MSALYAHPAFQIYATCSVVLIACLYVLALFTGHTRGERKVVLNPEDTKVYRDSRLAELEHVDVQRVKRAHLNLIENALPFFAIGLLYSLTDPSLVMAGVLFVGFVAVRVLHAVVYLKALQPARALAFAAGGLINLVMAVQVIRAAT